MLLATCSRRQPLLRAEVGKYLPEVWRSLIHFHIFVWLKASSYFLFQFRNGKIEMQLNRDEELELINESQRSSSNRCGGQLSSRTMGSSSSSSSIRSVSEKPLWDRAKPEFDRKNPFCDDRNSGATMNFSTDPHQANSLVIDNYMMFSIYLRALICNCSNHLMILIISIRYR